MAGGWINSAVARGRINSTVAEAHSHFEKPAALTTSAIQQQGFPRQPPPPPVREIHLYHRTLDPTTLLLGVVGL